MTVDYSETCVYGPISKRPNIGFQDQLSLTCNACQSIAECSPLSILQYFWPSLICHLLLRSLFCLFLSGRFTQVLLYIQTQFSHRALKHMSHTTRQTCFSFMCITMRRPAWPTAYYIAFIALVRWPPCELNISCTSTSAESRAKIWYQ